MSRNGKAKQSGASQWSIIDRNVASIFAGCGLASLQPLYSCQADYTAATSFPFPAALRVFLLQPLFRHLILQSRIPLFCLFSGQNGACESVFNCIFNKLARSNKLVLRNFCLFQNFIFANKKSTNTSNTLIRTNNYIYVCILSRYFQNPFNFLCFAEKMQNIRKTLRLFIQAVQREGYIQPFGDGVEVVLVGTQGFVLYASGSSRREKKIKILGNGGFLNISHGYSCHNCTS